MRNILTQKAENNRLYIEISDKNESKKAFWLRIVWRIGFCLACDHHMYAPRHDSGAQVVVVVEMPVHFTGGYCVTGFAVRVVCSLQVVTTLCSARPTIGTIGTSNR